MNFSRPGYLSPETVAVLQTAAAAAGRQNDAIRRGVAAYRASNVLLTQSVAREIARETAATALLETELP